LIAKHPPHLVAHHPHAGFSLAGTIAARQRPAPGRRIQWNSAATECITTDGLAQPS
jgi:hypothetical protein